MAHYDEQREQLWSDEDEARMEIIGQNGNEGTHYKELNDITNNDTVLPKSDELE